MNEPFHSKQFWSVNIYLFIVIQVTRKAKPESKEELQDWNYNFFEDFAMLGAPEKVAYNFKTLVNDPLEKLPRNSKKCQSAYLHI